jgi:hypothetical protein
MVSTSELTVAVSTDTVGPVLSQFFFLASAVWVAAIVVAAWEVGILPVAYRVRCGAYMATLGGALLVTGASSSLSTDESEMYSMMGGCGAFCTSAASRTL